jgi:hypothetical protein
MGRRPFPTCIAILPSPSPHPAVPAPPISLPHHCATFPFRSGCAVSPHILGLPLLRLPAPYLHTRLLPYTVSAAWAPAIPHGYGVLNPESEWGPDGSRGVGLLRVRAGPRPPRWEKEGEIRDGERSDGGAGETLWCRAT